MSDTKAGGVTYTPRILADFVSQCIVSVADIPARRPVRVLDPAVGDGELLVSLLSRLQGPVHVTGFETDPTALDMAKTRVQSVSPDAQLELLHCSFLDYVLHALSIFSFPEPYDLIIANPPYVRTQIIGSSKAKTLAKAFGLTGRVDLYHAFAVGMAKVLKQTGTTGFIVSNRFMTTRGGASLRQALLSELRMRAIYDLGDTKLFDASVLPAVIVARGKDSESSTPTFASIYETKAAPQRIASNAIEALDREGVTELADGRRFDVRHGQLSYGRDLSGTWRLTTKAIEKWLDSVSARTWGTFGDIGRIRVGVKTCADNIFIRQDWDSELELLRPVTTHHRARRFRPYGTDRRILYPHDTVDGTRQAISLDQFPLSREYLEAHRTQLERRVYLADTSRQWYELWVPQDPDEWSKPKLVFRDISKEPTFWMDTQGSVVNGDCYWMTGSEELLWLALAVGNSTFVEYFYDRLFNNKLLAGRRRYITQYVQQFPIPDPSSIEAIRIVERCKNLYDGLAFSAMPSLEREINELVWSSFGLTVDEEVGRQP